MARPEINNQFYDQLSERWYSAQDDPVALLRAESRLRNPWVVQRIVEQLGPGPRRVLDVGCGAGFLTNALALEGHHVTGVDLSTESLAVARKHDTTQSVRYLEMDAHALELRPNGFDAVCCMDFLEHTERPGEVIAQIAPLLRPGGLLFFHTFSRNLLSYLIIIKGVEWFVRNTPEHMHVYRLLVRPEELGGYLAHHSLDAREWRGIRPRLSGALWRMLRTGSVPEDFSFEFTRSLSLGYCGFARKVDRGRL